MVVLIRLHQLCFCDAVVAADAVSQDVCTECVWAGCECICDVLQSFCLWHFGCAVGVRPQNVESARVQYGQVPWSLVARGNSHKVVRIKLGIDCEGRC